MQSVRLRNTLQDLDGWAKTPTVAETNLNLREMVGRDFGIRGGLSDCQTPALAFPFEQSPIFSALVVTSSSLVERTAYRT